MVWKRRGEGGGSGVKASGRVKHSRWVRLARATSVRVRYLEPAEREVGMSWVEVIIR